MGDTRPGTGLQTIFGLFLGLMVTAFVGVGVYTFYPSPEASLRVQIDRLLRQEEALRNSKPPGALTSEDRSRLQALTDERNALQDAGRVAAGSVGDADLETRVRDLEERMNEAASVLGQKRER